MSRVPVRRHDVTLVPWSARVILRPFIPASVQRITTIIGRALALSDSEVESNLQQLYDEFEGRHADISASLLSHFGRVQAHVFTQQTLSRERMLLIGGLFSGEYAPESAALFNPSLVPHPDQSGLRSGALRCIMSLRATGEGHISSLEFRTLTVASSGDVSLEPVTRFLSLPEINPNPRYKKALFSVKLHEMGFDNTYSHAVMDALEDEFTRSELNRVVFRLRRETRVPTQNITDTYRAIQWLADSNYEVHFPADIPLNQRMLFPVSANESNGIEDARFVHFVDNDGTVTYYATYTAYNGHAILPQLIETQDFLNFRVLTLNGAAVQNKGMALFPRRIDGNYMMLSRQDDENVLIMRSDNPHYWSDPQVLLRPAETWEAVKLGNCGSPLETEAGWLVLTHGVGPMRKYCIGAVLLDLDDPTQVIGRLREPLLVPEGSGREGYVPNVVYSCGSLIHGPNLVLPYAMSDRASTVASIPLDALLEALRNGTG